ncbi:hypothetical protein LOTGIDRAFT_212314 [Lottia gigantea]|uniref:Uncharacterized protein n=1 Tax=Lottia gigantea TaxID=225164 RepID=V4CKM5_LOTGI|nr:hypothetical protein LOTGIDRAFT_212314 [Lottia gigantea]ESP02805.1 hypothetical protein LOTGIDRAFT_212314 [Lottia gigantea]
MAFISQDLFPNTLSFIVFVSYIALFVNQGILVTASKDEKNNYSYNTTTVIILTEFFKCFAFVLMYLKNNGSREFLNELKNNGQALLLYFVPAVLYSVYNNLSFINLSYYDPTTYFLLLQFKTVLTGIVFQILFSKKLSKLQWFSLILLTFGCILKEVRHSYKSSLNPELMTNFRLFDYHFILILIQVFTSVFASVYNEYLIKGCDAHFMIQNIFMYFDSIVSNCVVLLYRGELFTAFTLVNLKSVCQPTVLGIIANGTCIGICISFFLRYLNNILKSFASATELMFTAILAWIIFGIPVDFYTFAAIFVVTCAIMIYSRNPVVNLSKQDQEMFDKLKEKSKNFEKIATDV